MSGTYLHLGLFLCILFVCCSATSSSSFASRRSILREVKNAVNHPDYAIELNGTNFDAVLKETPATFAVVEFFAHWLVFAVCIKSLCFMCF